MCWMLWSGSDRNWGVHKLLQWTRPTNDSDQWVNWCWQACYCCWCMWLVLLVFTSIFVRCFITLMLNGFKSVCVCVWRSVNGRETICLRFARSESFKWYSSAFIPSMMTGTVIIPLSETKRDREREKDQIVSLTSKACSSCLSLSNVRVVVVIIPEIQEQNKNVTQSTRILITMPSGKGKQEAGEVGDSGGMSGIKPLYTWAPPHEDYKIWRRNKMWIVTPNLGFLKIPSFCLFVKVEFPVKKDRIR